MNHSHLLRLLDDLMFRGDTDAYVKLRGALIEDAERERLPEVKPKVDLDLPEVTPIKPKPRHSTKRKRKPRADAIASRCEKCGVPAHKPCISVGPRGTGGAVRYMHPERAGNRATLNVGFASSDPTYGEKP